MLEQFKGRPSHATVVAYVALFAALATGGAYAATQIGADDIKENAVRSKHIKNGQVKPADLAGKAKGPRAIAAVDTGLAPTFDTTLPVKGFESVSRDEAGIYCVVPTKVDPNIDPPLITIEYGSSAGENFTAMWESPVGSIDCETDEYQVNTYFAEDSSPTDSAAFVIVVP